MTNTAWTPLFDEEGNFVRSVEIGYEIVETDATGGVTAQIFRDRQLIGYDSGYVYLAPLGQEPSTPPPQIIEVCASRRSGRRLLNLLPCPLSRRLESMELLTPDEIVRLTPPERLALIAQLWDSLEHEQLPLTSVQEAELEHRLTSLDEDRRNGVTWASLKAELERRCP